MKIVHYLSMFLLLSGGLVFGRPAHTGNKAKQENKVAPKHKKGGKRGKRTHRGGKKKRNGAVRAEKTDATENEDVRDVEVEETVQHGQEQNDAPLNTPVVEPEIVDDLDEEQPGQEEPQPTHVVDTAAETVAVEKVEQAQTTEGETVTTVTHEEVLVQHGQADEHDLGTSLNDTPAPEPEIPAGCGRRRWGVTAVRVNPDGHQHDPVCHGRADRAGQLGRQPEPLCRRRSARNPAR